MERTLQEDATKIINDITDLINLAIARKQTNEQWFLDFLDNLNNYSVMF